MGGKISTSRGRGYSSRLNRSSQNGYPSSENSYIRSPDNGGGLVIDGKKRLDRKYSRIADNYKSLEEITEALECVGFESLQITVGIDFTRSNEWTGTRSFNRRSLHDFGVVKNPYEQAISIIGKTLASFDEDNLIPCFGFGDASTNDQDVFSFCPNDRVCNGFEEVLTLYKKIVPCLQLAGPTSFAPMIEMAMTNVEKSGGQFHLLLIITSGQILRDKFGPQKQKTIDALVNASEFPLSIILVGVGDGPWDMGFADSMPTRAFDNLQFVNFTQIMTKNVPASQKETEFALAALMEIPSQYKATRNLYISGGQNGNSPQRIPLPPPYYRNSSSVITAPDATGSTYENLVCSICLSNAKDLAFGCGHQVCCKCGQDIYSCPFCRAPVLTRVKLRCKSEQIRCLLCTVNLNDTAFGCGHQTCFECGQALRLCPICESTIQARIKLY